MYNKFSSQALCYAVSIPSLFKTLKTWNCFLFSRFADSSEISSISSQIHPIWKTMNQLFSLLHPVMIRTPSLHSSSSLWSTWRDNMKNEETYSSSFNAHSSLDLWWFLLGILQFISDGRMLRLEGNQLTEGLQDKLLQTSLGRMRTIRKDVFSPNIWTEQSFEILSLLQSTVPVHSSWIVWCWLRRRVEWTTQGRIQWPIRLPTSFRTVYTTPQSLLITPTTRLLSKRNRYYRLATVAQ